ncbi:YceD family protein [Thermithiobacillus plumbiphilus]|uniref:Large ribosomal RNA subunit accumulation protein YceD n=1 Tax=Thermithiobacillus plumbiphilus TaxID=1729899 RepID=A0ABU9D4D9_9PROT
MLKTDAKWLDLRQIGERQETLAGQVSTAAMHRLRTVLTQVPPVVEVDLRLRREQAVVVAGGEIRLDGGIQCQRCLGDMPLLLVAPVHSGITASETLIGRMDESLEPVLVEGDRLELSAWVEDEILLSLPIAPMCTAWTGGVCPVSGIEPAVPAT